MKKVFINWQEFDQCVEILTRQIKKSRLKFDGIYGIPRGGLPLAICLSHNLNLPILLYPTNKTLVADDISDTGTTLYHIKHKKIATLATTNWTITKPDWFVFHKDSKKKWIVFPWERQK